MSQIQEFDLSVNLLRAILWQYTDAKNMQSLLNLKSEWYNDEHSDFWIRWKYDVFDLDTANDFGLSVWAAILGTPMVTSSKPSTGPRWAFGPNRKNFGHGNLGVHGESIVGLTTRQKRTLLKLRAYELITRPTVPAINEMLAKVFKYYGKVYVLDPLDMSFMTYVFEFIPDSQLQLLIDKFDLLPRPSAVGLNYNRVDDRKDGFGFGVHWENFGHGTFLK